MPYLSRGKRVVVDTHVLTAATSQERAHEVGEERRLLEQVRDVCARIVISRTGLNELRSNLRRMGVRFPQQQVGWLSELDELKKVVRPQPSAIPALSPEGAEVLTGKGHRDTSDDAHLVALAAANDKLVISNDTWLLEKGKRLRKAVGVDVASPKAVLAEAPPSPEGSPPAAPLPR